MLYQAPPPPPPEPPPEKPPPLELALSGEEVELGDIHLAAGEKSRDMFIDEFQVERLQRLEVRFSLPVERRVLAVHKIIVKLESGGFYPGGEQLYAQPPRRGRLAGTGGAGEAEEPHLGARLDLRRGVAEQFRVQRFADHYHVP